MNSDKIKKQNDGIYNSLVLKGVNFERVVINDDDTEEKKVELFQEENARLKELAKSHKPPPQQKKEKVQQHATKPKEQKEKKKEEDNDEENNNEKKKEYSTITNTENIKRHFFNRELEEFNNEIKKHQFHYYTVNYKYNSDKDGAPDFSAINLLKNFVKNMDDFRKYFIVVFRCYKVDSNYEYESSWIVNTNDNLNEILGDFYEEFEFLKVNEDIKNFLKEMEKKMTTDDYPVINERTLIGEFYVH